MCVGGGWVRLGCGNSDGCSSINSQPTCFNLLDLYNVICAHILCVEVD
jgi:hypothetical protein